MCGCPVTCQTLLVDVKVGAGCLQVETMAVQWCRVCQGLSLIGLMSPLLGAILLVFLGPQLLGVGGSRRCSWKVVSLVMPI